jgi:hypothetical protein
MGQRRIGQPHASEYWQHKNILVKLKVLVRSIVSTNIGNSLKVLVRSIVYCLHVCLAVVDLPIHQLAFTHYGCKIGELIFAPAAYHSILIVQHTYTKIVAEALKAHIAALQAACVHVVLCITSFEGS